MEDAPERIWIDKTYGQHPEDWNFTDGQHLTKAQLRKKVGYVRADRIEALEAKLAKAVQALDRIAGKAPYADDPYDIARAALAELKGGKP